MQTACYSVCSLSCCGNTVVVKFTVFIVLKFLWFSLEDISWCKNLACSLTLPQKKYLCHFLFWASCWIIMWNFSGWNDVNVRLNWAKSPFYFNSVNLNGIFVIVYRSKCILIWGHVGVHLTFDYLFVNLNVMTLCDETEITFEGTWALAKQKRTFFRVRCILIKSCMDRTFRATYLRQFFLSNSHIYIFLI